LSPKCRSVRNLEFIAMNTTTVMTHGPEDGGAYLTLKCIQNMTNSMEFYVHSNYRFLSKFIIDWVPFRIYLFRISAEE
jgi:hypothetical protein